MTSRWLCGSPMSRGDLVRHFRPRVPQKHPIQVAPWQATGYTLGVLVRSL